MNREASLSAWRRLARPKLSARDSGPAGTPVAGVILPAAREGMAFALSRESGWTPRASLPGLAKGHSV